MDNIDFNINWPQIVQFTISFVLPLLVALVTTRAQSGAFRAVLLAVLTLANTVLAALLSGLNGTPVDLGAVVLTGLFSFGVSVASYFGLWKATTKEGNSVAGVLLDLGSKRNAVNHDTDLNKKAA